MIFAIAGTAMAEIAAGILNLSEFPAKDLREEVNDLCNCGNCNG